MKFVASLILLLGAVCVSAHQNSIDYLFLDNNAGLLEARWEISALDLQTTLGFDATEPGSAWTGAQKRAIRDYAFQRLILHSASGAIQPLFKGFDTNKRPAGLMIVLLWQAPGASRGSVTLEYNFGFDLDAGHECIVSFQDRTAVLTRDRRTFKLAEAPVEQSFASFVRVGVLHIFEGIDHICFLLALMLPAVWRRTASGWEPVGSFRSAFISIAKIVTAFTVAHSITLAIAALRIVVLPSAVVESIIALSVVIAALNNLRPLWTERSWIVAFGFGLVHGFGFASALADLPASTASFAISLAGFNIGVELGQLCIVLVFLPIAFLLRESWFYRRCAVRLGSAGIACVAAVWLIERAFQITIF